MRQPKAAAGGDPPGLYIVSTPIGNAEDITVRALRLLRVADVIACEDTRVTAKLLAIHGIVAKQVSYHDHNAARVGPILIARLAAGERVALVTDAGTPLISDPGYRLVRACIDAGIRVIPLPGPSAVLAALTVSGLPAHRFLFAGFLPPRTGPRRRTLAELAAVPATLVFIEAPHRLAACLADMADVLGPRPAVVARELTKMFEEVVRDRLDRLAERYRPPAVVKGEVSVVVAPPVGEPERISDTEIDRLLIETLASAPVREAAARVAAVTGLPRRKLYARALDLQGRREHEGG